MPRAVACLVALVATLYAAPPCPAGEGGASSASEPDSYPLDSVDREVPTRGRIHCPEVPTVRYRGTIIRYHKPVRVYVGFKERLEKFEEVVRDTAIEVYGRAPIRIRHLGTYNCRRIRTWPNLVSEHGLANAIDVEGFDFGRARGKERNGIRRALRRPFRVRVGLHWNATRGVGAVHARFLRLLAHRLIERRDIFRVLLGPSYAGHKNHFHFDVSPWRIVDIFGDDPS